MVQQRRQPVDVVGDEFRPVVIVRRDGADESGHQRELAPEHVVHDEHLATVEARAVVVGSRRILIIRCRFPQVTTSNVRICAADIAILGGGD
jgi:hypothetical protein